MADRAVSPPPEASDGALNQRILGSSRRALFLRASNAFGLADVCESKPPSHTLQLGLQNFKRVFGRIGLNGSPVHANRRTADPL